MADLTKQCLREMLGGDDDPTVDGIMELYISPERPVNWEILSLRFSNILAYGPDNFIEFPVAGICGQNYSGKTSLLDVIAYALYGAPIRTDCGNIVHTGATAAFTQIIIAYGDDRRRLIITRERAGAKTLARLEEPTAAGVVVISEDVRGITATVEKIIGPMRYLLATTINMGAGPGDLMSYGRTDRVNLFAEICGLNGHKEIIKSLKVAIKSLEEERFALRMPRIDMPAERLQSLEDEASADPCPGDPIEYSAAIAQMRASNMGLTSAEFAAAVLRRREIEAALATMPNIAPPQGDRAAIEKNLTLVQVGLSKYASELAAIGPADIDGNIAGNIVGGNTTGNIANTTNFITAKAEITLKLEKLAAARALLKPISEDDSLLRHLREEFSTSGQFTYAADCSHCVRNRSIYCADNLPERIAAEESRLAAAREKNADIESKLARISAAEAKLLAEVQTLESNERKRLRRERLQADIEKLQMMEAQYTAAMGAFRDFDEAGGVDVISRKDGLMRELRTLPRADQWQDPSELEARVAGLVQWQERAAKRNAEMQICREDLPLANNSSKAANLSRRIDLHSRLLSVAGNPKFPLAVIAKYVDKIAAAANAILAKFGLVITITPGEKSLDMTFTHGGNSYPLELCSGMQKLVISTALRIALSDVCPGGRQIFVDECGVVAGDNWAEFTRLPVILLTTTPIDGCIHINPGPPSKVNNVDIDHMLLTTLKREKQPRRGKAASAQRPALKAETAAGAAAAAESAEPTPAESAGSGMANVSAANVSVANSGVVESAVADPIAPTPPANTACAAAPPAHTVQRNTTINCGCGATIRESSYGSHVNSKKHQAWLATQTQSSE